MQYYDSFIKDVPLEQDLEVLRDLMIEAQPLLDRIDEMKAQIKERALAEEVKELEVEGASIKFRDGYKRSGWKSKELEGLALVYPEILKCKTETNVSPTVVIKVDTK